MREGSARYLVIRNSGPAHARLTAAQWVGQSQHVDINPGLLGYVLADSETRWLLTAPPPADSVPEVRVNGGDVQLKLPSP